jgi:dTDP-4-dehydrorhamnose reductase
MDQVLDTVHPQIIVNAAAFTAVDLAEAEESLATRINGDAVGQLGRWAVANNALVVHISTDYVFAGRASEPYTEDAPTSPLNAYGRSKLVGELALRDSGASHFIFRTAWLYAPHGKNFFQTMLRLGAEREELRVVSDQWGSPTPASLLAMATITAVGRWIDAAADRRAELIGLYHVVAGGQTSWRGFAEAIVAGAAARGALAHRPRVIPIDTAEFPTPAVRPRYSVLDNSRFETTFSYDLATWEAALESTLDELSV